jgi:ribosomal protein S18 acetylase RimI-like enzyme
MSTPLRIERAREATPELLSAFHALLPALSPDARALTQRDLEAIVAAEANILLIARKGTEIVGTATVVMIHIPSGRRARLESVVVAPDARGNGIGEALCREAIALATQLGAEAVDLTSAPSRAAANRLYERLGFTRRTTNVYRLAVPGPSSPGG